MSFLDQADWPGPPPSQAGEAGLAEGRMVTSSVGGLNKGTGNIREEMTTKAVREVNRRLSDGEGGDKYPQRKRHVKELPGRLVVRTLCVLCWGPGSIPGQGTEILRATWSIK